MICFFQVCYCLVGNGQYSIANWTFENIGTAVPSVPIEASSHSGKVDRAYAYLSGGNNNGSPDVCSGSETWATNFWPTGSSRSSGDYLEFEAEAKGGYDLIITNFSFSTFLSSASGPRSFEVYYSIDGGSEKYLGSGSNSFSFCRNRSYSLSEQTASGGRISFRIYPYEQDPAALAATLRIDNVSISGQALLPVRLMEWTGEVREEGILLRWATATEHNSHYFSIERRTKHTDFEEIERRPARGEAEEITLYSYLDAFPVIGANYYRLKQVDRDGSINYSEVIVLQYRSPTEIQVFPTIPHTQISLDLRAFEASEAEVSINDLQGHRLWYRSYIYPLGLQDIDVSGLKKGMYVLVVTSPRERVVKRFFKQ